MYIKFQVDWISSASKTTLTKNFNINLYYHFLCSVDREIGDQKLLPEAGQTDERTNGRTHERTNERMNEQTHRTENILPLYYCRWGIKYPQGNS